MPYGKAWTWLGALYVAAALAWGFDLRGGNPNVAAYPDGVTASLGYTWLLVTVVAGALLTWIAGLHAREQRAARASLLVPPNMMFEDKDNRRRVLSWATVVVFYGTILLGLSTFGDAYKKSEIHLWNAHAPLSHGFLESRLQAFRTPCESDTCFAMGLRMPETGTPIRGVYGYMPYLSDLLILAVIVFWLAGGAFLVMTLLPRLRRQPARRRPG